MLSSFKIDIWTLVGLMAQGLFFLRFIIQWWHSEKARKTVIPQIFWYISLVGAMLTLLYSLARKDVVFFVTAILQIVLYIRSLMLGKNE